MLWLQQGFQLEFLGKSTFVPGLWAAGLLFFAVNCWILGIIVKDIGNVGGGKMVGNVVDKSRKGKVVELREMLLFNNVLIGEIDVYKK